MIGLEFRLAHLLGNTFEHGICKAVAAPEALGELDRLVENDAVGRFRRAHEFKGAEEQNRALDERHALQIAVDEGRKSGFNRRMLADDARKERSEELAVRARPVFNREACAFNGAAVLFFDERAKSLFDFLSRKLGVRDPFIDAEERENARGGGAGNGLGGWACALLSCFLCFSRGGMEPWGSDAAPKGGPAGRKSRAL